MGQRRLHGRGAQIQVAEYSLDDHGIFDAGDHLGSAAALTAGLDVDVEHPLEALCPRHGGMTFGGCGPRTRRLGIVAPTPPGRRHLGAVGAVRGEHAVVAGEINSGPRYQGGQAIHRLRSEQPLARQDKNNVYPVDRPKVTIDMMAILIHRLTRHA